MTRPRRSTRPRASTRASHRNASTCSRSFRSDGSSLAPRRDRAARTITGSRSPCRRGCPCGIRLGEAIERRRSVPPRVLRPIRLRELATLLACSYAARGRTRTEMRRPVPSAGALYPLELYVLAQAVAGLEPGVYHYNPFRHRLSLLGPVDRRAVREALADPSIADAASAIIVVTGVFWRSRFKYGQRGYRFALLEAGHLVQNAASRGRPTRRCGVAVRRVLRPTTRRSRQRGRARRGERAHARARWCCVTGRSFWARFALATVLSIVVLATLSPPRPGLRIPALTAAVRGSGCRRDPVCGGRNAASLTTGTRARCGCEVLRPWARRRQRGDPLAACDPR